LIPSTNSASSRSTRCRTSGGATSRTSTGGGGMPTTASRRSLNGPPASLPTFRRSCLGGDRAETDGNWWGPRPDAAPWTFTAVPARARRSRHDTANSTCVTRHAVHRARRGRSTPTPRTHRARALPPRRELTAATRAGQLTREQPPIDLNRIRTYHHHGCTSMHQARPSRPGKEWGGPLRYLRRDQVVVAHEQRATRRQPQ
jgi:hypothetical protein